MSLRDFQLLGYECEVRFRGHVEPVPHEYPHTGAVYIVDDYFLLANPQGRLRKISMTYPTQGERAKVTYKYDKDSSVWESEDMLTREDVREAELGLQKSGYRTVITVEGLRQVYHNSGTKIDLCLDNVESLGPWTELEKMVVPRKAADRSEILREVSDAMNLLRQTAVRLGASPSMLETRTYPQMIFENRLASDIADSRSPLTIAEFVKRYASTPAFVERACQSLEAQGMIFRKKGMLYVAKKEGLRPHARPHLNDRRRSGDRRKRK